MARAQRGNGRAVTVARDGDPLVTIGIMLAFLLICLLIVQYVL